MAEGSARALAAVLRSLGIDAEPTPPPSDGRTLDLGAKFSSGDECYPLKVTLGGFLRILEQPGLDPKKTAFFLTIFQPGCEHVYSDFGEALALSVRGAWRAIVSADILLKLLLKSRPYEVVVAPPMRHSDE